MVGKGWHKEPWRHGLSAKGIKTGNSNKQGYFQPQGADVTITKNTSPTLAEKRQQIQNQQKAGLSPTTALGRLRAERQIKQLQAQDIREQRTGVQELRKVQAGDFSTIQSSLGQSGVSEAERRAITAEANRQAVQLAQAGLDVPESLESELTSTTQAQLKAIKDDLARAQEGAFTRTVRTVGLEAVKGLEQKSRRTEGEVRQQQAEEQLKIERADKVLNNADGAFPFADLGSNVFLGDGINGIGKEKDDGAFDFISQPTSETSPLSSSIVPQEKFKGIDFGMDDKQLSFSENLANQVESLWSSRDKLGKIDVKPLDKGNAAFLEGNREKLIESINDQEFQIKQQESRWKLVDQTRQQVESSTNRESIFNDKVDSPFSFSMFSNGGDKIADETEKINDVKRSIKQGADEARARAANLRGKLQRLDSTVPPEESLPEEKVTVFQDSPSLFDGLKNIDNPLIDGVDE